MIVLETIAVAFSLFSALPMPQFKWNERNMRWSLCAFPLVGAVIAAALFGWQALCALLGLPPILRGAGLCLLPVVITGGIHLDGYADTCDALASHSSIEKRQEILKDPHLGAFAAIRLCGWFIANFALWTALADQNFVPLLGLFCLPRALSALALACFPLRPGSGLARRFADAADKKRLRLVMLIVGGILSLGLLLSGEWPCAAAAWLLFWYYRRMSERQFGGVSGDLAGWFVQTAELWMLAGLALRQFVEAMG